MAGKRKSSKKSRTSKALTVAKVACGSAVDHGPIELLKKAKKFRRPRGIHTRRIIPEVRRGAAVADTGPSAKMSLGRAAVSRRASAARPGRRDLSTATDLSIVQNVELRAISNLDTASDVCEPSMACKDDVVFYTGNWFAALSTDGGTRFRYVDPYSAFPDPPGMRFCCDQIVHYIRKIDMFVWLLQYGEDSSGANIQRLAYARTADVRQGRWRSVDLTPRVLGVPGQFLDFPDIAVGTNMLYVTTNAFRGERWTTSIIVRLPFSGLRSGNVSAQRASSTSNFNFRMAQHCGTTAYFASHEDSSTLRLYSWPERSASPTFRDVAVGSWEADDYSSPTPDGRQWLNRADSRLLGATKAGDHLYFAWSAGRGGTNQRPQPYVQIAKVSARTRRLRENINIWDANAATAYPALATNNRRQVGITFALGGGRHHPSQAVGTLTGPDRYLIARAGRATPRSGQWGDYLTIRRRYPNPSLFAVAGFTKKGGTRANDSTPSYVVFGRTSHV
ncbi:MAG: hypothetical protein ACR2RD_14565 [Woeseiaceae bacterium]